MLKKIFGNKDTRSAGRLEAIKTRSFGKRKTNPNEYNEWTAAPGEKRPGAHGVIPKVGKSETIKRFK